MTPEELARFMTKVEKRTDGCWEWRASRNQHGYGWFGIRGRVKLAHRVSLEHALGAIPPGMLALHTCDNPPCVNPDHLYAGTAKQNTQDMIERGRGHAPRGLQNGRAKLSESDVANIRLRSSLGESFKAIARDLGLHPTYVGRVAKGLRR